MPNENNGIYYNGERRIVYVEPNDIYGVTNDANGRFIQQTIPQEDLCIAFDLRVKNFSRFRENRGVKGNFILSWTTSEEGNRQATFLGGDDFGKSATNPNAPTYLTTYYTDISFDNYGTQKIVEGLGVEQIQVAWESWYTPTVTIKFVDVRGSAIWSNEEAIHENGQITADNIFGCFFTFPYPMFTLQMKGFLGNPVSYQLTCSGFQGEYDSNTGNFIATATFIGYSYSLMTDVPMQYLIMAPECDYVGRAYWDSKVNSAEWALSNDKPPLRLSDVFKAIKGATPESIDNSATEAESDMLTNFANKRRCLNEIKSCLDEFIGAMKTQGSQNTANVSYMDQNVNTDETINRQLILFYDSGNSQAGQSSDTLSVKTTKEAQNLYNKLVSSLKEYNASFTDAKISTNKLPNGWTSCPTELVAKRIFYITKDSSGNVGKITLAGNSGKTCTPQNIHNLKLNDKRQIELPLAEQINNAISKTTKDRTLLREFCYIIDINDFVVLINKELDKIHNESESIEDNIAKRLADDVSSIVGFRPYIGDVFKIIMCHLETFINIMYSASTEIYSQANNGLRNPGYLGIHMTDTDIPFGKCDYVTPWPKVINKGNNEDGSSNTVAWVGDFSHNFTEEKVVLAIEAAIRKIQDTYRSQQYATETDELPLTINDFIGMGSPFDDITDNLTPSSLAGYLGFRAFQVLGVMCYGNVRTTFAELFGKIDAYNLYKSVGSVDELKSKIINPLGSGKLADTLIGVAKCDINYDDVGSQIEGSNNRQHAFETERWVAYDQRKRHPIITENGNRYNFAHYYTVGTTDEKPKYSLIPAVLKGFKAFTSDNFKYTVGNDYTEAYYSVKSNDSNDFTYVCNTTSLSDCNSTMDADTYVNHNMFNVVTDSGSVDSIMEVYDNLCGGTIRIGDVSLTEDFSKYTAQFMLLGDVSFGKWMKETNLSLTRSQLGVEDKKLLPLDGGSSNTVSYVSSPWWIEGYDVTQEKGTYHSATLNADVTLNGLTIQEFEIVENCSNGRGGNLFMSPFYYMQNNITDPDTKRYVKALLFLHTFKYNYNNVLKVFQETTVKGSGSIEVVPYGYLLFLGGLLWRSYYGTEEEDPIVWSEGSKEYKAAGKRYTLFRTDNGVKNGKYIFTTINKDAQATYFVPIKWFFGDAADPDANIRNQLITLFKDFADKEFPPLMKKFEVQDGKGKDFTYATMKTALEGFQSATNEGASKVLPFLNSDKGIKGWAGVYRMMLSNGSKMYTLLEENLDEVETAKEIYTQKVVVLDGCYNRLNLTENNEYAEVTLSQDTYSKYINSFVNTLTNDIIKEVQSSQATDTASSAGSHKLEDNKDICANIYSYCKNLWDKWLVQNSFTQENMERYNVKNFFDKRFHFIDSFYRNMSQRLPINCERILHCMEAGDVESSLSMNMFTYIDYLLTQHGCMFFSLPSYIGVQDNADTTIKHLSDMFRAIPYNNIRYDSSMDEENNFIAIYTSTPAKVHDNNDEYVPDGFDIWSVSNKTLAAPAIFSNNNAPNGSTVSHYGYYVPSFGVQINRQNNHIFKNIKLSMANPVITDAAARAMENIYNKGGEGERRVVFHGQDMYQVFTAYAYQCEVEMMGCSQIWPLMFFQLLNIPMWRGTYMIFKVTHTMTPGNMVTTFTGIKQSSTPIAFAQSFFSVKNETDSIDNFNDYDFGDFSGAFSWNFVDFPEKYEFSLNPSYDHYHLKLNHVLNVVPKNDPSYALIDLYNQLYETIQMLDENGGKNHTSPRKWNMLIYTVWGEKGDTSAKTHEQGKAMDIWIGGYKEDNETGITPQSEKIFPEQNKKFFNIVDILYTVPIYRQEIKRVQIIYDSPSAMCNGSWYSNIDLHFSVKRNNNGTIPSEDNKTEYLIVSKSNKYQRINSGKSDDTWFLENVPPEFRKTASRCWDSSEDKSNFRSLFPNYQPYSDEQLTEHFTAPSNTYAGPTPAEQSARIKVVMGVLKQFFSNNAAIAIAANMGRESGFNPRVSVIDTNGKRSYGICQWQAGRENRIITIVKKLGGPEVSVLTDLDIYWQAMGAVYEMQINKMRRGSHYLGHYNYTGPDITEFEYFQTHGNDNVTDLVLMFLGSFERGADKNYEKDMFGSSNGSVSVWVPKIAKIMGWSNT